MKEVMIMATFRFTAGPWNVHEGNETFGPGHRKSIPLEEKMKKYAKLYLNIIFQDMQEIYYLKLMQV